MFAIEKTLASGCSIETAALAGGVSRRTLNRWLQHGQEAEALLDEGGELSDRQQQYLRLLEARDRALATAEVAALASVQRSAREGNVQSAIWLLERMYPDQYAPPRRTNGGAGGRPRGSQSAPDRRPEIPKLRKVS